MTKRKRTRKSGYCKVSKQNITKRDLDLISNSSDVNDAKAKAFMVLLKMHPDNTDHGINLNKYGHLHMSITEALTKQDIIMIMYNVYLAGEGLATIGSSYQKGFNSERR